MNDVGNSEFKIGTYFNPNIILINIINVDSLIFITIIFISTHSLYIFWTHNDDAIIHLIYKCIQSEITQKLFIQFLILTPQITQKKKKIKKI